MAGPAVRHGQVRPNQNSPLADTRSSATQCCACGLNGVLRKKIGPPNYSKRVCKFWCVIYFNSIHSKCWYRRSLPAAAPRWKELIMSLVCFVNMQPRCSESPSNVNFKWTKRLFIHIQERELFWSVCALWMLFPESTVTLRWSPSCYRPFRKCQRFTAPGFQH